jgi:P27 family predicted phage terminase small subunit
MNENEPEVGGSVGGPPMHLNATEKHIWNECAAIGFWLTEANRGALEGYVTAWAMMIRAKPDVENRPLIGKGPNGGAVQNPWLAVYNKALEQMLKFASELGFTPTSITRIHAPEREEPKKAELIAFDGGKK